MFHVARLYRLLLFVFVGVLTASAATNVPSLDELKVEGARQSILMNHVARSLGGTVPQPGLERFRNDIEPVLSAHCVPCHGPEKAKARLRIDTLDPNLLEGSDVDWWLEVLAVLGNGEMPPPDESELPGDDRGKAIEWLSGEIRMASMVRRATGGHSSFRRLTRYEYNYALQDLLGLPREFARDLPPEARSEDGFQNSSENLHMSVAQLETYRQIARKALLRATVRGPKPPELHWGVSMEQASQIEWRKQAEELDKVRAKFKEDAQKQEQEVEKLLARNQASHSRPYFKNLATGQTALHTWSYGGAKYAFRPTENRPELPESFDHVAIIPPGHKKKFVVELGEKVPDEGILRVRVRASRLAEEEGRIPSMQLEFGWQASNEGRALLRVSQEDIPVAASSDEPQIYQWNVPLGDIYPRNSVRKTSRLGSMPSPSEHIRIVNSSAAKGAIQIDYVEVSAPVYEEWPPASHKRVFFDSENRQDESLYAHEVLSVFMARAWRRAITEPEIEQKLRLFSTIRRTTDSFEESMIEVLATVLSSPDFLYLFQGDLAVESDVPAVSQGLSDYELAARLSMFLWCSLPDDQLLELAGRGPVSYTHLTLPTSDLV